VIAATDALGYLATSRVTRFNPHWWGSPQESTWVHVAKGRISFQERDLTLTVNGDELTAVYKVSVPSDSPVVSTAEADTDSESGDDLVDNVLGQVEVGEFHYGITGQQLTAVPLTFQTPQLQITKDSKTKRVIATLDVTSDSFRLFEHRQQITILPSGQSVGGRPTSIMVSAPDVQVTNPSLVKVGNVVDGQANLTIAPAAGTPSFTVAEGDTSPGWFEGLRGVGGIELPIADPFLSRLSTIFTFAIFLWAFQRARRAFPGSRLVNVAFQAAQTVVVALSAVAVLGLADDLSGKVIGANGNDYLLAGPVGLLVGAAVALWPVACWRAGTANDWTARPRLRGLVQRPVRWQDLLAIALHLAIVELYVVRLVQLQVTMSVPMFAGAVLIAVLTAVLIPLLVRLLFGRGGLLTWLSSAGLLGAVFVAATSWPLLLYNGYSAWYFPARHQPDGNPWGKWAYVAVAVAVAAGLCLLWGRVALAAGSRCRTWLLPVLAATAVAAVILVAILPDSVSESGVGDPNALGLVASQLFTLFDAAPQLLDWLLVALAIVVVMTLTREPDSRATARDLALPVALQLFYWNDTWLYLPVTAIAGIFLIRRLMMPRTLVSTAPGGSDAESLARKAAADWRHADFVAAQQQALAANGAEALRDSLLKGKNREFERRLARLAEAQDDLAAKLSAYQRAARTAGTGAFSHLGAALDPGAAAAGAITGAIAGIVPAAITMLTISPPSAGGSYPILGFFGSTAWYLFSWAGLGWFIGYFLPLIRGDSGVGKALWIFVVGAAASIPDSLVWNDAGNWAATMINDLEFLVFLVLTTVIVCDLRTLWQAGLRPADWIRVHNWRFAATWSAALIAAVGTIAITFATTTVTDLSQRLTQPSSASQSPTGSATTPARNTSGAGNNG